MGIDFGSEFYKISIIAPGKSFVIMENTFSKRKTHSAISFLNDERFYESESASKKARYPSNTFFFFKKFISALENEMKTIEISKKFYEDYMSEINSERGTFTFKVPNFDLRDLDHDQEYFHVNTEEILAMILSHAKYLAEKQIESVIKNCVFTVPSTWTLNQRNVLYTAAVLADFYPLSFIHENTAAALNYAFERQDVNQTHTVLFYNLGSSSLKVTLVEFVAVNNTVRMVETLRVLAEATEENVSGREFDFILAQLAADLFDNLPERKGKASIRTNRQAFRRVLTEVTKFKEMLSANKEANFFIESLLDDIDFRSLIERSLFESKSSELLSLLTVPIEKVLSISKKTLEEVDAIEIIGGGVRIPMVQNRLNEYFNGKELGQHLNGDETFANGAVFQAANYSLIYKVRPIWVYDGFNFGIKMGILDLETKEILEQFTLFENNEMFMSKKKIEINGTKDLQIVFEKINEEKSLKIFKIVNVTNITDVLNHGNYTNVTNFTVLLDLTLCSMKGVDLKVYAKFEEKLFVEYEYYEMPENFTVTMENDTNSTENIDLNETINLNEEILPNEINEQNETNITNETNTNETKDSAPPKLIKEMREVSKKHEIKVNYTIWTPRPRSLNPEEIVASKLKIKFLNDHEEVKKNTTIARNSLEEFIYKIHDLNSNEIYLLVSNETQRQPVNSLAEENQEWLESDEGYASNYSVYVARLKKLHNITTPITYRMEEYKIRPQAINDTFKYLKEFQQTVIEINKTHPWIPLKQKYKTMGLIIQASEWLNKTVEKQSNMSLFEMPVLKVYELSDMLEALGQNVTNLKSIKPPKNYYENLMKEYAKDINKTKNAEPDDINASELLKNMENLFKEGEDHIDLDNEPQLADKKEQENAKIPEELPETQDSQKI